MQKLTLDVFGRRMLAEHAARGWRLYLPGADGKRRQVPDVVVPPDVVTADDLLQFLDDHFHELATPSHRVACVIE